MMKIQRALLSVWDKQGIVEFAHSLDAQNIELLSSGGTARVLRQAGLEVQEVADVTGSPEMFDGRVKTLHPAIHAGILARRDHPEDLQELKHHEIGLIDLVVVNLYPFALRLEQNLGFHELLESIDIGGPTLIRAAAKNFHHVAVLTDPLKYGLVSSEIERESGSISLATRHQLALEAFNLTQSYDSLVAGAFAGQQQDPQSDFLPRFPAHHFKTLPLRYGENPHQKAALYRSETDSGPSIPRSRRLSGKALSYTNVLDLDAALRIVASYDQPSCVVIKHAGPCGAAVGTDLESAWNAALAGDPLSAYGGIAGSNRPIDQATARAMITGNHFLEAVLAPSFEEGTVEIFQSARWGQRVRLIECPDLAPGSSPQLDSLAVQGIHGGLLVQDADVHPDNPATFEIVAGDSMFTETVEDCLFAFTLCRHVKSNAIVLARAGASVGIGAGQMSRVDAVQIALEKAGERARGAVLASDAFFPFRDSIDRIAEAGISAVIQPGGSRRDEEVITACNEHGIPMIFTGCRHFRH